jgi:hypothetical protein
MPSWRHSQLHDQVTEGVDLDGILRPNYCH